MTSLRLAALLVVPLWLAGCGDDSGTPTADSGAMPDTGSESGTDPSSEADGDTESGDDGSTTAGETVDSTGSAACTPADGDPVQELVTLTSDDGKALTGVVTRPTTGSCLPAVVLIHQFGNDKSQWDGELAAFVARGYVTLAIDLRGHGESDPQDGAFNGLLTDPDQAPLDVQAAIAHLANDAAVDSSRIGVVGTSIGANLAVVAASQDLGVAATVAISARLDPVESLLGGAAVSVGPLLCFAGETDGGGDQAMTCSALEPLSSGPAMSVILPGTAAHGVAIVDMFPETFPAVLDFLDANV
ncbi:MAG: alpha/beta fold hydrolase [Myxococcota bacterium]